MLTQFQFEDQAGGIQAKVSGKHLDDRGPADVRPYELLGGFNSLSRELICSNVHFWAPIILSRLAKCLY